jgi:hypothetical protein
MHERVRTQGSSGYRTGVRDIKYIERRDPVYRRRGATLPSAPYLAEITESLIFMR